MREGSIIGRLADPEPVGSDLGVVVLIATRNRPDLLVQRALCSARSQTHHPLAIVVVDDSDAGFRAENQLAVERVGGTWKENVRASGASGAWNTGLLYIRERFGDVFIAILDDDDAWEPAYLERCLSRAVADDLDMVAADILRIEAGPGVRSPAPDALRPAAFLIGNPNIQGSSLFVRLHTLCAAGLFDETLRSSTDRDLCLRLCALGDVAYGRVAEVLVHHHAEPDRRRLSTAGSAAKLAGMSRFWSKWSPLMNQAQRQAFGERARRLFGWSPGPVEDEPVSMALVVGVLVDGGAQRLPALVEELVRLCSEPQVVGLDVLLVDAAGGAAVTTAAARLRESQVDCHVVLPSDVEALAEAVAADDATGIWRVVRAFAGELVRRRLGATAWLLRAEDPLTVAGEDLVVALARHLGAPVGLRAPSAAAVLRPQLETTWFGLARQSQWGRASGPGAVRDVSRLGWLVDMASDFDPASMASDQLRIDGLGRSLRSLGAGQPVPLEGGCALRLERSEAWVRRNRVENADAAVGVGELRVLGLGSEGVAVTDGRTVFKYLDYWKSRDPAVSVSFLRTLVGRLDGRPGLCSLESVRQHGAGLLLTYPFEESEPYAGGPRLGLLRLLDSCRRVGIVCRNVHPKNLRVTGRGVVLVDYGSDIRPFTAGEFECMARRAWLSIGHANRPDLAELMRAALTDGSLPEFAGFDAFWAQVCASQDGVE